MLAYLDEDVEKSTSLLTGLDEVGSGVSSSGRKFSSRRYRDSSGSKTSELGIVLISVFLGTCPRLLSALLCLKLFPDFCTNFIFAYWLLGAAKCR